MVDPSVRAQDADEIDLVEVAQVLWAKKTLIILITAVVTAIAIAYAFSAKPVFESKLYLQPPTYNDIAEVNYGRTKSEDLEPFSVKDVYALYIRNLQSEQLRRDFFENVYLPSLNENERKGSKDLLYTKFTSDLGVVPVANSPDRYSIVVQNSDPSRASEWAQLYASKAGNVAEAELIRNVTREAKVRARNLEQQINVLRQSTDDDQQDAIVKLREALKVAESIGLENPPIISGNLTPEISAKMDGPLTYMRGAKALRAEIKNLESRATNDPFIRDLRELQAKLGFYKKLTVDPDQVQMYRQDGNIDQPDQAIKPKKGLIIVSGFIMGLLLALVISVILIVAAKARERSARRAGA